MGDLVSRLKVVIPMKFVEEKIAPQAQSINCPSENSRVVS